MENKPKAPIVGADSNVFNLIGICSKALKNAGYTAEAQEMTDKVMQSSSYDEALSIMLDYIEPVGINYDNYDDYDDVDVSI